MLDKSFGVGPLIFGDDCKYKFCSCFFLVMRQAIARVDTQLMGSCPDHSEKVISREMVPLKEGARFQL